MQELEGVIVEGEEIQSIQDVQRSDLRATNRRGLEIRRRGRSLRNKLAAGVQSVFGVDSMALVAFGVKPRLQKPRRRLTPVEKVTKLEADRIVGCIAPGSSERLLNLARDTEDLQMNRKLSPLLAVAAILLWAVVTPADAGRLPIPKPPRLSKVKVVPPEPGVRVPRSDFQAPKMARPADPSKGVYKPRTLREHVLFGRALARPRAGMDLTPEMGSLNDPRWHHNKGWVKMAQDVHPDQLPIPYSKKYPHPNTPIHVHYNFNQVDGSIGDPKIKGLLLPK